MGVWTAMKYASVVIGMLAAWGLLTLVTSAGLSNNAPDDPRASFDSLKAELWRAQWAFADARKRRTPRESAESANRTDDPRVPILRKMDELAEASVGTQQGQEYAFDTFGLSWQLDADLERLIHRFARLVEHYPNHPDLVDPVAAAARAYKVSGSPSEWVAQLEKLSRTTQDEDLRIGSLYIMGQVEMASGNLAAAKETFNRMIHSFPESEYIPRVKGYIYDIEHLQPGMNAPDFSTRTLDQREFSLESQEGKIVLLNFWATWCPTCLAEVPELREAYHQLHSGDPPFEIINVSLDEDRLSPLATVKNLKMPGLHTWELVDGLNPVARKYNVYGLPARFLIDDRGVIRSREPFGDSLVSLVKELRR